MVNKENQFELDTKDEVTGRCVVTHEGKKLWPDNMPPPQLDVKKETKSDKQQKVEQVEDTYNSTLKRSIFSGLGLSSFIGLGVLCPQPQFLGMMTTFTLALIAGYQSVWGVVPALHTPLMSVTNAISGLTAAGGILCLGGGFFPGNFCQALASLAVLVSTVNIFGGFIISNRMLNMFKRSTDAAEYNHLYGISGLTLALSLLAAHSAGVPHIYTAGYLAASICCIGSIVGLASMSTARVGAVLGNIGVGSGVLTTLLAMNFSTPVLAQSLCLLGGGAAIGTYLGKLVQVTELPQTVAGFHALVGLAAVTTSLASYGLADHIDSMHIIASYFGVFIGGVTLTGSLAAFRKLANLYPKDKMHLPYSEKLNMPIYVINLAALGIMILCPNATAVGALLLFQSAVTSCVLGWNITNSIGGADMPVAITVLNSYSGWALCAEGFMLNNNLLTIVGSLIGSSGAILSYIMCVAMNRSLTNVIFGGYAALGQATEAKDYGEHVETTVDQVVELLANSQKILIVPGYGLAVAQGQYMIGEISKYCIEHGKKFEFGIHPVAGRMPGQLNVLLAEVGIPYDIVFEMDEVNPHMDEYDVVIVLGANDIVNPSALEDENSPIAGMPVIEVWRAKQTIVVKRTMGTGYADIPNPLFYKENNMMLLGNAKDICDKLKTGL